MSADSLLRFVLLRVAFFVPLLVLISIFVFALVHLAPGDAASALTGGRATSAAALEALRAKYHLNDPLIVQYGHWLGAALQGDFGQSIQTRQGVIETIASRTGLTLWLALYGTLLVMLAGVPLGMLAALRRGGRLDRTIVGLGVVGVSTPAFVSGLFLLYYLGFVLDWFPVFGPGDGIMDRFHHLTLPAVALALSVMAIVIKVTRACVVEELGKDYIAFARARGLTAGRIRTQYLLRNALVPVVTAGSVIVVALMASSIYVEITFALPGMGSLLIDAVRQRDVPLIQGATLFYSVLVVVVNLATDVVYALIDPRIRHGAGS